MFYTEATFMNTYWEKRRKGKTVDVYTQAGSVMGTFSFKISKISTPKNISVRLHNQSVVGP